MGEHPSFTVRLMGGLGLRALAQLVVWYLEKEADLAQQLAASDWERLNGGYAGRRLRDQRVRVVDGEPGPRRLEPIGAPSRSRSRTAPGGRSRRAQPELGPAIDTFP